MKTLDGWLSSKKSDAEVARDSKLARDERNRNHPARRTGISKTTGNPKIKPKTVAKPKTAAKAKTKTTNANSRSARRNSSRYDSSFIDDEDDDGEDVISESEEEPSDSESEEEAFDSGMEDDEEEEEEDDDVLILDEEEDEEEEDDDHEVIRAATSSRRNRAATRNSRREPASVRRRADSNSNGSDDNSNSDSDSDSDESDSLLFAAGKSKPKLRPSAPSKLLTANASAAKRRFNPSLDSRSATMLHRDTKKPRVSAEPLLQLKPPAMKQKQKQNPPRANANSNAKSKSKYVTLDDDEDDEELTSPLCSPNKKSSSTHQQRPLSKQHDYEEIFSSSDEENNQSLSTSNNRKPNRDPVGEKSRYFEKPKPKPKPKSSRVQNTILLDDSDSDDDMNPPPRNATALTNANPKRSTSSKSKNSLEDSPELPTKSSRPKWSKTAKSLSRYAFSIDDSSDDDDAPHSGVGNKNNQNSNNSSSNSNNNNIDDSDSDRGFDEDTRIAMRLSLAESKKQKQKQKPKQKQKQKQKPAATKGSFKSRPLALDDEDSDEVNIETILDDSSDDEEDGDLGDEYYDKEKETATSVLRSAEKLSGHVVRAMSGWFKGNGSGSNGSGGSIQGMIVDGAVSLGDPGGGGRSNSNNNENGNDDDHQWIDQSVMAKACPDVTLSPYQLVGVNWMALLNGMTCEVGTSKDTKNVNGVLADEMGLGKTVQTIAFLAWLRHRRTTTSQSTSQSTKKRMPPLPHLIVVPVSTLPNWIREFEKFCPEMNVVKYHGSQPDREILKEDLRPYLPKYRNQYATPETPLDVIVAPVSYFSKENSPDRKFLSNFAYDYLVVDEAHNLKNAKSTRYKMLDRVKTEHRLLLTGTPVQNNPQELLNMLSFIMPLFSKAGASFEEKDNYTEQMLKHFVDEKAEHGDEQTAYKKLKQLFAPFVLRRKKDDVISQLLPKKTRKTVFVELSDSTRSIYENIIKSHFEKNGTTINPGTGEHLFTNLRKCAHHPLLLRNRWNSETERNQLVEDFYRFGAFKGEGCTKRRVAEEIQNWNDFNIHLMALDLIGENEQRRSDLQRYVLEENDLFCSSKFESLRDLLPGLIRDGHRILVFSSWTSCLDLLGCLMQHLGIQFQRMDGSTTSDERQRLIDRFNGDASYSVFLLSTKACGLGINLTSADTCIIHDLDFNPFNDLQAEDRCHRIGQKKPVTVYKLISKNSVDEDIFKMQEKKAKMNAAIMDSASSRKEKNAILKSVLDKASHTLDDNEETVL